MRENRNSGSGTSPIQAVENRGTDIPARGEVTSPRYIVRECTVDEDLCSLLNERLDLHLPLLGMTKARGTKFDEQILGLLGGP